MVSFDGRAGQGLRRSLRHGLHPTLGASGARCLVELRWCLVAILFSRLFQSL